MNLDDFDRQLLAEVEQASSPTVAALQSRKRYLQGNGSEEQIKRRKTQAQARDQVPAPSFNLRHAPPMARGIQLVCTSQMPDRVSAIFPYEILNAVQSKCFPVAFESNDNLVVSAPTGSGKTVVMELAICRLVMETRNADFKVIYQAPTKSLCSERYHDWSKKFKLLGLDVAELTGDTSNDHLRQVQQARIIITTPEKWDSITRKWRDNRRLLDMIKLFLVDEVHILKDSRGATLEAVVSRMKSIGTQVRFIALSATVPNSEDIAAWLGKSPEQSTQPARIEVFDESFRPVRLEKHVYGFQYGNNDFSLDNHLRKQVPDMIIKHSKKKATMVFCMTRKSALQTAQTLAEAWRNSERHQLPWPAPRQIIVVGDTVLRDTVQAGVAFHHGGLSVEDRHAVEQGFLQGFITVICSTSTLAVGVNLPCYLVVLQGTTTWATNAMQSYSDLEVMQMLGRAGRPQFEQSACAVILTREQHVSRYQKMVSGQELLESTLHLNLVEHLNAEIGLGTIRSMALAQKWLASTFLRVRVMRNPGHYQLEETNSHVGTDEMLQQWCEKDIQALLHANMVEDSGRLKCTELGDAMAKYYVNFDTMKIFTAIPPKAKLREILSALTRAAEFSEMRLRSGEKSYYKELNKKSEIMFPVNVDIALPEHKVSIILQAELGGASQPDGENFRKHHQQHSTERLVIFSHANRLIRCIIDCQIYMKDSVSVRNALELGRCIAAKVWDSTPRQLKQVPEIGDVLCRKLASQGINSIEKLLAKEAYQIEMAVGKTQPFGTRLLAKLQSYPRLRVSIKEMGREIKRGHGATLRLRVDVGFLNTKTPTYFHKTPVYVCFVVEDSNGNLLDFRRFSAGKLESEPILLSAVAEQPLTHVGCSVMCDEIVGTAMHAELKVSGIPDAVFPAGIKSRPGPRDVDHPAIQKASQVATAFDDDDIEDADLLAATEPQ
ncbi:ATP-dependent DNA helicase MER3 [Cyphellophora attinorum]|uniref:DNA 3'-5' helicase n=1 Tax=Cyphellophora attinorum TaxID=1664694 RepID=A0A0N1H542_9EURO|nr:ATP-dependent DNA helicase MER3 [Phialophora attinorum]KPI40706.1 ATP-dependent DNA helicase MER3 [Phialophora attinorum]